MNELDPPPEPLDEGLPTAAAGRTSPRPRRLELRVVEGEDEGRSVAVDREVLVGTSSICDLVLRDRTVSRRHLQIRPEAAGLRVRDLGSRNGTFCGGIALTEGCVGIDTELRLGHTRVQVVENREPAPTPIVRGGFGAFAGRAECLQHLYATLDRVAATDATVLLEGESGVGKELLARALHDKSPRAKGPFVTVDCGSIPTGLVASELFGHEAGAFTGALGQRLGAFELADGGTLFLDELGELSLANQVHLLRALESREVQRVGGTTPVRVDLRVVAATHRNLDREVEEGRFRLDLFHRLAVVALRVPPLRERLSDVPRLARRLIESFGGSPTLLDEDVLARLLSHGWPGNVRELRNYVERLVVLQGDVAPPRAFLDDVLRDRAVLARPYREARQTVLEAFHASYVANMLALHGTATEAAKEAQIARRHFHRLKAGTDSDD